MCALLVRLITCTPDVTWIRLLSTVTCALCINYIVIITSITQCCWCHDVCPDVRCWTGLFWWLVRWAPQRPPAARKLSRLEVISSSVFTSCFLRESLNSDRFSSSGFHYAFLLLPVVSPEGSRDGLGHPHGYISALNGGWRAEVSRVYGSNGFYVDLCFVLMPSWSFYSHSVSVQRRPPL